MPLQALLDDVHPAWFAGDGGFDPDLIAQARSRPLGQRLLVRALPADGVATLLAPRPGGKGPGQPTVAQWPRSQLAAVVRDLGVLAYAPMIRAEVRREPVRWLRKVLGNSYLLALDRTIWDGQVDSATRSRLSDNWEALLRDPGFIGNAALIAAVLDRQGRQELRAWAERRNRALGEWARLVHGDEPDMPAHLPDKAALVLCTHHERRAHD